MGPTPRSEAAWIPETPRRRLSLVFAVAGFTALAALGGLQLAKDGSFWIDEASVAQSLVAFGPVEMLTGPLAGGQSFPRFLLLAISGATAAFGYQTAVARALPQLFFLLWSAAACLLVYRRFRDEPALVALAGLLLLVPATPVVYGAMLKPYSFDAFLALLPFLLPDRFYEQTLARGERLPQLGALTLGVAFSYPFAMVLLARLGGWWLARARRGDLRLSPRGALVGLAGIALCGSALWLSDLRHTGALAEPLQAFWARCRVGGETGTLALLDRFAMGWWDARADFSQRGALPAAVVMALRGGGLAGLAAAAAASRTRGPGGAPDAWGSRSLGCAVLLCGLPVASLAVGYPICAGRLTWFALVPLLLILLEGLAAVAVLLRHLPRGRLLAAGLGLALVAAVAPTSTRNAARLAREPAPQDLRPLLAKMTAHPDWPVLTNVCSHKQIETLPEGLGARLLRIEKGGPIEVVLSETREAWLLVIPAEYCAPAVRRLLDAADHFEPLHEPGADAQLFALRLPEPGARRRR